MPEEWKECRYCRTLVVLRPRGLHYKWVDRRGDWHCGNDPERPLASHQPEEAK